MRALWLLGMLSVALTGQVADAADGAAEGAVVEPAAASSRAEDGSERWREYFRDAVGPGAWFGPVMGAAFDQRDRDPAEWGQGAGGYARRFGARFAQGALQASLHHGGAALLRHETRYTRCDCSGALRRTGYAFSRVLLTRNESGRTVPNVSFLAGTYGGAMISTYWYPARYRPHQEGVRFANIDVAARAGINLVREFSPELKRLLRIFR